MSRIGPFNVTYDHESDVLYVSTRREGAIHGMEDEFGVLWRYDKAGTLIGVTIVDFRDVCAERGADLMRDMSRGFDTPVEAVQAAIEHGLKGAAVELH
jgi:uncharacterized protein YuzE